MARLSTIIAFLCLLAVPSYRCNEDSPLLDLASSFLQNMGDDGGNSNGMAALGSIVGSLMQGGGGNNAGDVLSSLGSLLGNGGGSGEPKIDPALIGSMISMFAQNMASTETPREKRESKPPAKNDFDFGAILNMASGFMGSKDAASFLPVIMNAVSSLSKTETGKLADEHKDHASFLPPFLEKLHLYWDLFINSDLGRTVWEKSGLKKGMKAFTGPDGKISFEMMFKNFENQSFRRHWIKVAAKYMTDFAVHFAKPDVYQNFLDSQGLPKSTHFSSKKPEKSMSILINYVLKKYLDIDTDVTEYVKPAIEYAKQILKMAEKTTQSMSSRGDYSALADRVTDTLNLEIIEPVLRVYRAYKHSIHAPHCQEHLMCLVNRHPDQDKRDTLTRTNVVSNNLEIIELVLRVYRAYKHSIHAPNCQEHLMCLVNRHPDQDKRDTLTRTNVVSNNLEIIELVLRVYRAYKHSIHALLCQEHLMYLVNRHPDQDKRGLPGFKAGLTKLTSLAASAALSFQNGRPFWDLYNAVQNDKNCERIIDFHEDLAAIDKLLYYKTLVKKIQYVFVIDGYEGLKKN
ncbi:Uncharacterized protein OBRU01_20163 [Operophtera brumata]|uniref:Uncharacterized protein n=1 Tax=Operophtera brumata TaxID=104452 RepID=A0A0L7KVA7_OPEBR|nr:Uncharacterized protein OBRU01_20163 [Operophtera brumata]